jgi:pimeloyl-ACP methyl ester carboxylesterase
VDIGPEISKRAAAQPAGPPEPDTWESIEQAAQHLLRGNPFPGIHYYRWVASTSLKQREDGALIWKWHPSVKERRSQIDFDWWEALRSIRCPALVLRGESSPILDRDVAERMGKELPNGRFVEIPRAVHTLHEDNPDAVVAALKEFLKF